MQGWPKEQSQEEGNKTGTKPTGSAPAKQPAKQPGMRILHNVEHWKRMAFQQTSTIDVNIAHQDSNC